MKNEKISAFVLAVEIVAIICLHSVKDKVLQVDTPNAINIAAYQPKSDKLDNQLSIPLYAIYTIQP